MEELSFINFIASNNLKVLNAIELGGGDGKDANYLCNRGAERVVMIDKKDFDKTRLDRRVDFILDDYFNLGDIETNIHNCDYDLLFSCYSLCFNTQQNIEEKLPFYLQRINKNGMFYLLDFTLEEKIVTKRTNLNAKWFLNLISKYFNKIDIQTQELYEESHGHTHSVFQLIGKNRITPFFPAV